MGNSQPKISKLTRSQIADLKERTKFSEIEIEEWHKEFYDECSDGKLGKAKFVTYYKKYFRAERAELAEQFCTYIFNAYGHCNDKKNVYNSENPPRWCGKCEIQSIDFPEFLLAISSRSQVNLNKRISVMFDIYDISGDKKMNKKELENWISSMFDLVGETDYKGAKKPKDIAAQIMNDLDKNKDESLTKDEVIEGVKNHPDIRQLLAPYEQM